MTFPRCDYLRILVAVQSALWCTLHQHYAPTIEIVFYWLCLSSRARYATLELSYKDKRTSAMKNTNNNKNNKTAVIINNMW